MLDFVSCVNVYAQVPMDFSNKTAKRYVTSQAKRTLSNLDSKRGQFATDSLFADEPVLQERFERAVSEGALPSAWWWRRPWPSG